MTLIEPTTALDAARWEFRNELLDAGLLIGTASAGIYGRSGTFEAILAGLDRVLTEMAAPLNATTLRFPPVYPRADFERTEYIASFPDLAGIVSSFEAGDREHRELLAAREEGHAWDGWLTPSDVVLTNAICHPLYATLEGRLPEGGGGSVGSVWDIFGYGFRHEPSLDPMRMQSFRMHEFVYVGDPDGAQEYRDTWLDRAVETLASLGLAVETVAANDPFFGRAGKMLVSAQLRENLKIEITVPMYGDGHEGTAIASANCQRDHLTAAFGIRTADGEIAHGACLAFGMERTTLALLRTHGLDVALWPLDVRARLGL
jgi:seryl-tRNA synthetase